MSKIDLQNLVQKIKFFLKHKISWKKNLTFLFFLVLAIVFWILQVYSEKILIHLSIPIKYTNIADDVLFEKLPESIEVDIKDYGASVLKYASRTNDTLVFDIGSAIIESEAKKSLQGQELEQLIRTKLLPTSEIISYTPTLISYAHNQIFIRKIPVLFDGDVNLSTGYQLDGDIYLSPDTVIAYGAESALDTLKFAYTERDTLRNITESRRVDLPLLEPPGVTFRPSKVKLNIPVDLFLEKREKVKIECVNLPESLHIKFFPSEVVIPYFVGLKRSNQIQNSDFKVQVDYLDIKDLETPTIPIRIIESPEFVRKRQPEPYEVEFILEEAN